MAVSNDDVNDKYDMHEHVLQTQNDSDSFEEDSQAVNNTDRPAGEVPHVVDDNNYNNIEAIPQTVVDQNYIEGSECSYTISWIATKAIHQQL